YTWDFGDGNSSTLVTPTHSYAESGIYSVSLTAISTTNGCPATVSNPVEVLLTPVATIEALPIAGCPPLEVVFNGASTAADLFIWTFGDGNAFIGPTPTHIYTESGTFTAQLLALNGNGCADSTLATITVYPKPEAAFTYTTEPTLEPILPVQFENRSIDAIAYQWELGDGTMTFLTNPFHTYSLGVSCSFTPMLIAYNQFGCVDTTRRNIGIGYDLRIWAPNAFRPDGDGLNEEFVIRGADIEPSSVHLMIFNRWGELIHETRGKEPRWDGRINGTMAKNDVYVWKLSARLKCGFEDEDFIGHVTLIR
ncbi:MAG: PKD domain-containing protein, partial [Flavobacteriales bacterium]